MKTIEMLMDEHQVILGKINEFKLINPNNIESQLDTIDEYIIFFKEFADKYHHAKEENILFGWMLSKNPGLQYGPISVMLADHESGRKHILSISELLPEALNGNQESQQQIINHIYKFCENLTIHIEKEDNILYMIARELDSKEKDGDEIMWPFFLESNQRLEKIAEKYL